MDCELNSMIREPDIVRFMKSRRLKWLGDIIRTSDTRALKRVLDWKPTGGRRKGRPEKRWLDDVDNLKTVEVRRWRRRCQKRMEGRKLSGQAKTHLRL
ncbi:hypothetical protein Trydic_g22490 [Trypoxylus dichotomus]